MADVKHAQATLQDLGRLVVDVLNIIKDGISIADLPKVFGLFADLKATLDDALAALPELKDVDAAEAGLLAATAYQVIQQIVAAILAAKAV